jgi:hypothetical protein
LVTEVDTGFQQFFHGDVRHVVFLLFGFPSATWNAGTRSAGTTGTN